MKPNEPNDLTEPSDTVETIPVDQQVAPELGHETSADPDERTGPRIPRRGERRPERERIGRADVVDAAMAVVVAIVAVIVAGFLGLGDNLILLGALGYATFVAALVGLARRRSAQRRPVDVDLTQTGEEDGRPPRAVPPAGGVVIAPAPTPGWARTADREDEENAVIDLPALEIAPTRYGIGTSAAEDRPIKRSAIDSRFVSEALLSAIAAAAIAFVLSYVHGDRALLGLVIWWYIGFLGISMLLVRDRVDPETALDHLMTTVMWSVGLLVVAALAWMMIYLLAKGIPGVHLDFFREDMSHNGPLNPGGGAFHAIVGSIEQVGIATIVVVPVAVMTAVYLHEMQGFISRPVRFIVDAMAGLPSIVAGLFIFAIWVSGRGFTGFSASLALIVLMLPTVTRTSEEVLRTIPDSLREASLALGAPQWRVVTKVVIPTALSGLVTASLLGIARAIGETAPLILTASGSSSTNWNPFHGPQEALPLYVYQLIREPNVAQHQRAWTGMLVLVMIVLVLFVSARLIAGRSARKLGRVR